MRNLILAGATTFGSFAFQLALQAGLFNSLTWLAPWVWGVSFALWVLWLISHPKVEKQWLKSFHETVGNGIHAIRITIAIGVFFVASLALKSWTSHTTTVEAQPQNTSDQKKPDVTQETKGNNSPNQNILGNGNNNNYRDPEVVARLKRIEKAIADQTRGNDEALLREKLLREYQLGYVIFDLNYQNSVLPYYSRKLLDSYYIDWNVVRVNANADIVAVKLPNIASKKSGSLMAENSVALPKRVGVRRRVIYIDDISINVEILAITKDSVVFVIGLEPYQG